MGEPSSQASQASQATTLRMGGGDDDDEMDGYADEARGFAGGRTSPEMASGSADTTGNFLLRSVPITRTARATRIARAALTAPTPT